MTLFRVLMVTARYPPYSGGVEAHVREVAPRIAAAGAEVHILTTDLTGELPTFERSHGVSVHRVRAWPADRDWYVAPSLAQAVDLLDVDVVHVQGIHTAVAPLAMLGAIRKTVPFVLTFHTGGHASALRRRARFFQWLALRPLLRKAGRLIGVSRFEIELFRRALRFAPSRFALVRNGAGFDVVPGVDASVASGDTILSVGRLERYKGHHRAIAALPYLPRHVQLEILGAGPMEAWLRAVAVGLGVGDRVRIRSVPQEDRASMAAAIRCARAVVLLSDYEAHPVAVMEALALGRPVVVAATSGLTELAAAGLARAVDRDASPATVAAAITRQMDDPLPVERARLPTWDGCAAQLLDIYRAVAEEKR